MKKILTFLNILVLGVLMVASCNLNNHPKFDEKDAFVAFDKAAITVKENAGSVKIPVTLASISGIATTISYEAVDSSAKVNADYELVDGAGTLSFTADARTQYIEIKINPVKGVYTGDKIFILKFKTTGSVKAGVESTCAVTISDEDHPLSAILATYEASGKSYFNGDVKWDMTFRKDEKDVSVVWIVGVAYGFVGGGGFYGTVKSEEGVPTTITIPVGQINTINTTTSGDGNIYLFGLNNDDDITDEGKITVTITDGGAKMKFDDDLGPCVNAGGGSSYYDLMFPGITLTKK